MASSVQGSLTIIVAAIYGITTVNIGGVYRQVAVRIQSSHSVPYSYV